MRIFRQFFVVMGLALAPTAALQAEAFSPAANPSLSTLINGIDRGTNGPAAVLSELSIAIDQHGTIAEVTIDARITNPSDELVEATFTMQLPRSAVVTGYALDIDGVMIPGSLIDQPKARQVYEDEVRGNIDPGLAEVSATNRFSTRIYPIIGEGSRRIMLKFVTPVDAVDGLSLPLATVGPVDRFRLSASATGVTGTPLLTLGERAPIAYEDQGRGRAVAEFAVGNERLAGDLRISGAVPGSVALISEHANGRRFFTISDTAVAASLTDNPPRRVRVYWDSSRSRADALHAEERALLGQFIDLVGPEAVDIVRFSSAIPEVQGFGGGEAAAVDAFLAGSTYRGATSFAGLDALDLNEAELCILFSDGGVSLDHTAGFDPDCPLLIVASGPSVDSARLSRIAAEAGAMELTLTADNTAETLERMQRMPISVADLRDGDGRRLDYRMVPAGQGRFTVVGELRRSNEVQLVLAGTRPGDRRKSYTVAATRAPRHNGAGVLWAAQEVAKLSEDPADRERMKALSQEFQVASPTMAFLVLERPDQYVNAEIDPPAGFGKAWMENYAAQKAVRDDQRQNERNERLEYVVGEWTEARAWWEAEYDMRIGKPVGTRPGDVVNTDAQSSEAVVEGINIAPPPPPPPPPPSSPRFAAPEEYAEASEADRRDRIVVTGSRVPTQALQEAPLSVTVVGDETVGADGQYSLSIVATDRSANVQVELADVLKDQPYLRALDAAADGERIAVLAQQEAQYGTIPAFYLDVAEWFRLKGEAELARQLLLSALDLGTADDETTLIVAFRLERDGDFAAAVALLERLAAVIDYRTQPKRTLALAIASQALTQTGSERRAGLERAFALLREVILEPTDGEYAGIEVVALMELNALIPLIDAAGGTWEVDNRLVARLDTDVRIAIEWTSPDADIDLWVTEPSGEQAYYGNQRTRIGGKVSNDMTDGYGPEEYAIRRAPDGQYEVRIKGFDGDRINPNGPGRVMVRLFRNFARADQSSQLIDAEVSFDRSDAANNDRAVATITVGQ